MSHFSAEELEKFNEIFFKQDGKCAACGEKPEIRKCDDCGEEYSLLPDYSYQVDNEFDNLICFSCEIAIGRIIQYLEIPEEIEKVCGEYLFPRDESLEE
jgi:hypothetical protein